MSPTLTKEIKAIVRREVASQIREIFADPEAGFELSEKAKHRLRQARVSKSKTVPFSEIKKKYY